MQTLVPRDPVTTSSLTSDFLLSAYHETRQHTRLGEYGESYAKRLLLDSGYLALKGNLEPFSGDLRTINSQTFAETNIEVKTAYCGDCGKYKFCLRKDKKTDICHSDYVILICIDRYDNHFIYCIPCRILQVKSLTIASHPTKYAGKYARYRVHGHVNLSASDWIANQ